MTVRAALLIATVAVAASPADARERRRDRHDGDGVASFLAGAVIAGGLVALLAKKDTAPAAPLPELAADETDAANLCADAAERQLWDDGEGREARVERFDSVTRREQGGFKVKGRLRAADGGDGYRMKFSCIVKGEEVRSVTTSI